MVRGWSAALGVGLVILWIAGLSSPYSMPWLSWLDGVGALCAFLISGMAAGRTARSGLIVAPALLAAGLYALWIIALSTRVVAWQTWWTFAFACASLVIAIAAGSAPSMRRRVSGPDVLDEREQERFRKGA